MTAINAFFDESYHDENGMFCVAGYVFRTGGLRAFEDQWQRMLRDFDIPFLRMSLCAHRNGLFEGWEKQRTIDLAARAIGLIKTYSAFGVGIGFRQDRFRALIPHNKLFSTLYELLVWQCLTAINVYVKDKLPAQHHEVGYFFEAGHQHAVKAGKLMQQVLAMENFIGFQSSAYAFVTKENCVGAQAADLLAWHLLQESDRKDERKKSRSDFISLCEANHYFIFGDDALIIGLAEALQKDGAISSPTSQTSIK